jgi:hypothetical protein
VPPEPEPGTSAEKPVIAPELRPGRLALFIDWLPFALARRLTA